MSKTCRIGVRGSGPTDNKAARAAWTEACANGQVSQSTWVRTRLASNWAVTSAAKAVDLMYTAGGGSAIYTRNPLQRHFRDMHAATQHALESPPHASVVRRAAARNGWNYVGSSL